MKVQQKQRQKHFNRQIPAAATLIQVGIPHLLIFDCHSTGDNCFFSFGQCLWRCYAAEPRSLFMATWKVHIQDTPRHHGSNAFTKAARRASLMKKRRFSKNRFDLSGLGNHISERKESDASIVFAPDDGRASSLSGERPFDHHHLLLTCNSCFKLSLNPGRKFTRHS